MPAQIVLVHDNLAYREDAAKLLRRDGYEVAEFPDALAAMNGLGQPQKVALLITRVRFGTGRSNCSALARWMQVKANGIRVIFVANPESYDHVKDLGVFLPAPVMLPQLLATVREEIGPARGTKPPGDHPRRRFGLPEPRLSRPVLRDGLGIPYLRGLMMDS